MGNIVIIGGGVTGLSAGIHLLLREGNQDKVTICEAHGVAGGNLTGWDRGGCHIDNCVHWLTGTLPGTDLYRMWQRLGVPVDGQTVKLPSLFTVREGGKSLTLWRDMERTWREMLALSFEDHAEINRLFHAVRLLTQYGHLGLDSVRLSEAVRYSPVLMRYWLMSTGTLSDKFRHPLIRRFVTGVCGRVFSAVCLVEVISTFCSGNGDLPAGGSTAMADAMVRRFRSLGGELLTGAEVRRVQLGTHTKSGKNTAESAVLSDGRILPVDQVIFTGDPSMFCGRVIGAPMPQRLSAVYRDYQSIRFSGIHAAFEIPVDALTFSGDLILPLDEQARVLFGADQVILREFSHEPGFAPEGSTVLIATVFCPENTAVRVIRAWQDKASYRDMKRQFAGTLREIAARELKLSADHLRTLDVWTPATYRRFVRSEIGSFMSFVMKPGYIPHKLPNRLPGVDNVILAGQWLRSPGGLPLAAEEGVRACETVTHMQVKSFKTREKQERRPAAGYSHAVSSRDM